MQQHVIKHVQYGVRLLCTPDSDVEGINVHQARKNCGRILAQEAPIEADIVVGVPDSGLSAAIGYAEEANIPFEIGMVKNKYIGRNIHSTFTSTS